MNVVMHWPFWLALGLIIDTLGVLSGGFGVDSIEIGP